MDLAVTSGLREDLVHLSARDPAAALLRYEDFKCSYKDTKRTCMDEGLSFTPLILEAVGGGWGAQAHKVLAELAKTTSSMEGEPADTCSVRAQQRISLILHRENARAVLRHLTPHLPLPAHHADTTTDNR